MRKLLITILSLIMALSVFAMVGCELEIEDYPEGSSGSVEQGSTGSTEDSSTGGAEDSSSGTEVHTHTYGNWEITKPTQTEEGTARKVCLECEADTVDKEITVTLPVLTDAGYVVSEDTATCELAGKITYKFTYNEETIEFDVETVAKGHAWDSGKVTTIPTTEANGEITYTCSTCNVSKIESIEKIAMVDAGVATADTALTFTENETIIGQKKFAEGVKVVGVTGYTVVIDSNKKSADGIDFTNRLKLGGTIKKDYRYIEISVDKACTVKVYAMSSSKGTIRNLNMYTSLADLTETGVLVSNEVNGDTLTAVEYNLSNAGTYYLGSSASGINIYGIYITFPAVETHNFATEWTFDDNNHFHACLDAGCTEVSDIGAHTWDEGVETKPATTEQEGEKTYTCTVCSKQKTEVIPKLDVVDTDVVTQDTAITFTAEETVAAEKKLADGVKVVGKDGKTVIIEAHSKGKDGIDFTHRMKLGGVINADSRYIEIKAGMACKVKIYAMSATSSENRMIYMFKSLADVAGDPLQKQDALGGSNLSVLEFHITEPGTYYFGSAGNGINVYGIYITKAAHAHNFDTVNWLSDEQTHYHACLIEGCTETLEKTIHAFDNGVETKPATTEMAGEKTYTCTVCGKVKIEEIPKIHTGDTLSVTFSTPDGQAEKLIATKDLGNGVKLVATDGKTMQIKANKKTVGDKTFEYRLELTGKMNSDSRYIEVTVTKACAIKVYAMSASSSKTRNLIICKTAGDLANPMQSVGVGGAALEVVDFTVTEAGTYYIGSGESGINVYGLDILYS